MGEDENSMTREDNGKMVYLKELENRKQLGIQNIIRREPAVHRGK